MTQATAIVVTDSVGASTTFTPSRQSPDFAQYEDRSSGVYAGYGKLTYTLKRPTAPKKGSTTVVPRNLRASVKIETPVIGVQTINGLASSVVRRRPTVEVIFTFPEDCTVEERKRLHWFTTQTLQNAQTDDLLWNYATPA